MRKTLVGHLGKRASGRLIAKTLGKETSCRLMATTNGGNTANTTTVDTAEVDPTVIRLLRTRAIETHT